MQLEIPNWANWIATDSDGYRCYHEFKPVLTDDKWVSSGRTVMIGEFVGSDGWAESLMQIERFINDNVKF